MALTSSSTASDALNQYNDNLTYWTSTTKASNLLEAILWIKGNRARVMSSAPGSVQFEELDKLEEKVSASLSATDTGNRTRFTTGRVP